MNDRWSGIGLIGALSVLALALGCAGGQDSGDTFSSVSVDDEDTDGADTEDSTSEGSDEASTETDSGTTTDEGTSTDAGTTDEGTSTDTGTEESTTGEPACARVLWTYDFDDESWDEAPLDAVWAGENAPPCEVEPLAATYIDVWDTLLVIGGDGTVYRRDGGAWQVPAPIDEVFGVLAGEDVQAAYFIPPELGASSTGVTFASFPDAVLYEYFDDGTAVYDTSVPMVDESANGGPNQTQLYPRWYASMGDRELLGQEATWFLLWLGYAEGHVYMADGGFTWQAWPMGSQAPPFAASAAPNPEAMEAAWADYQLNRLYLVGPG